MRQIRLPQTAQCVWCGGNFKPVQRNHFLCSDRCREAAKVRSPDTPKSRDCAWCKKEFKPKTPSHILCSPECAKQRHQSTIGRTAGLSTGTVGAIGELAVAAHLMAKGYHVYRALSPHTPFDLFASKGSELLKVEVRTGRRYPNGKIVCHELCHPETTDLYVCVLPSMEVIARPITRRANATRI